MATTASLQPTSVYKMVQQQNSRSGGFNPITFMLYIATCLAFLSSAAAAPIIELAKRVAPIVGTTSDSAITIQGGILGVILIICGFLLCFFGYRLFHVTMFLIGFFFFANIVYIGMVNGGVTSETWLLVAAILVGIVGGLLLVCCSRLGVAVLGALALYSIGVWVLGWISYSTHVSGLVRGIILAVLVIVGFFIGFCRERFTVIVGSAIVGAFAMTVGIDMFTNTGYATAMSSTISGNNPAPVGHLSTGGYILLAAFIVLSILGIAVQHFAWGRRTFRPAAGTVHSERKWYRRY